MDDELILNNINLIYKVINDNHLYWNTEDEYQKYFDDGLIGLIKGAKTFDAAKSKPSTYLYKCIKNGILKGIQLNKKINKEIMISLDDHPIADNNNFTYADVIEDPNINIEEDFLNNNDIQKMIYGIENILTERQKIIICSYYGICGYDKKTTKELLNQFKCSYAVLWREKERSKSKLKNFIESEDVVNSKYRTINGKKTCIICEKTMPIEEFNRKTATSNYTKNYCKHCEEKILMNTDFKLEEPSIIELMGFGEK